MINDYYYNIVSKQQSSELHAQADQDRLAKQVRLQRRAVRAARREAARLSAAVNGRHPGFWGSLRTLITPNGFVVGGADGGVASRQAPADQPAPTQKRVTVER
jgi:hypothetical protein